MASKKSDAKTRPKRVTMREIADAADVSIATVSYVLNDRGAIGEATKKRIHKAIKKFGYTQNRAARAMKTGRTAIIGFVFPNIDNPFFASLARAVLDEAQNNDYQVFLVDTEGSHKREKQAVTGLLQQGVDGIVLFPVDDSDSLAGQTIEIPIVILDRESESRDLIQAEYFDGGRMIARYLQDLGHTRFGILEGPQVVANSRARSEGFMSALGSGSRVVWRLEQEYSMTISEQAKTALLKKDISALVCGNDLIAMGAMSVLQSNQIAIPGEVSVVGFDDIPFASMVTPKLTTVRMPYKEMGREAVNLLLRRMDTGANGTRNRVVLTVELVERESSAPRRGKTSATPRSNLA